MKFYRGWFDRFNCKDTDFALPFVIELTRPIYISIPCLLGGTRKVRSLPLKDHSPLNRPVAHVEPATPTRQVRITTTTPTPNPTTQWPRVHPSNSNATNHQAARTTTTTGRISINSRLTIARCLKWTSCYRRWGAIVASEREPMSFLFLRLNNYNNNNKLCVFSSMFFALEGAPRVAWRQRFVCVCVFVYMR